MQQQVSLTPCELSKRIEALNQRFGCVSAVDDFQAAYKAKGAGNCPVEPGNPAAAGVRGIANNRPHAKVGLYLKLASQTARLWEVLEASPEPQVVWRDGGTHVQLSCDGLSFEKRLPPLKRREQVPVSVFRTVEALIEGYNRMVTERMGPEFVRALGGFDEGLLEVSMMFDAIVQGYEKREGALMPPDQLEAALAASYDTLPALMQLNYFPQKIFDELIVADINPFMIAGSVKEVTRAEVRTVVWDFLERLGGELFTSPFARLLRLHHKAVFEYILERMQETVCGTEDRGQQLRGPMLELFGKIAGSLEARADSENFVEGIPLIQQVALRLSKTRIRALQHPYTEADALLVLQRTMFIVKTMLLFASYMECPENRFTIGCVALRAGILKRWYARFSAMLVCWYRLEYELQAASHSSANFFATS